MESHLVSPAWDSALSSDEFHSSDWVESDSENGTQQHPLIRKREVNLPFPPEHYRMAWDSSAVTKKSTKSISKVCRKSHTLYNLPSAMDTKEPSWSETFKCTLIAF